MENISEVSLTIPIVIQKDDDWFVAKCVENSVVSQGKTVEVAMNNLKEAIELYYEYILLNGKMGETKK